MKSFSTAETSRLIALEAKMDQVLFGQHYDPQSGRMVDDNSPLSTLATAGAVAGGGYAGFKGVQAVGNKMDALSLAKRKGGMGKDFTGMGGFSKAAVATKEVGKDIGGSVMGAVRKVRGYFDTGTLKRVTELSAKVDKRNSR